jgi:hypothetical protein
MAKISLFKIMVAHQYLSLTSNLCFFLYPSRNINTASNYRAIRPHFGMLSRTLHAQDDFSSLGIGPDTSWQPLDGYDGLAPVERDGSVDSLKSQSPCEADEMYRPVNFIPDEVYELIRNWERSYSKQKEVASAVVFMDSESFTDSQSRENVFEPMRSVLAFEPPPKRFYRTFWRSATRRILQLEKKKALRREIPTSDASEDGSSPSTASL